MGHEGHHHEERKPLGLFASPLHDPKHDYARPVHHTSTHSSDVEEQKPAHTNEVPFENMDCSLHDNPAFHRHAEATTAELFYDLFFVANLTTFTSNLEINDRHSLTAYIGFFSLLWLTWYQVSLYDVRFSTDSVFERIAKAVHFGAMVGFAVIGPQWKPGQEIGDYKIYKAFGLILMVSRLTLFAQYGVTLFYTRKYKKTVVPLALVMGSTLLAAILYGALTPAFPKTIYWFSEADQTTYSEPQKSNVYIAWYIIGICEVIVTVAVSCIWRVISFKGTHMVQRMSLLTLIILGEGIIVVCKSISKIVKNDYLWTASVVGQIIAAIVIIYFLYMLYFDRLQEEHFGSIKQQIWSFLHFPLHTVLVLVLQGVSLLVIWRQAVDAMIGLVQSWQWVLDMDANGQYATGAEFAYDINQTCYDNVFNYIPKGVDASGAEDKVNAAIWKLAEAWDYYDGKNATAEAQYSDAINEITSATLKTLFDNFSVTIPKKKGDYGKDKPADFISTIVEYYNVFDLVVFYVFIAGGLALILTTFLGYISLPKHERRLASYVRLAINGLAGIGLCLVVVIRYNATNLVTYMESSWMIPTICLVLFVCVVVNHIRLPKRKAH